MDGNIFLWLNKTILYDADPFPLFGCHCQAYRNFSITYFLFYLYCWITKYRYYGQDNSFIWHIINRILGEGGLKIYCLNRCKYHNLLRHNFTQHI